MAQALAVLEGEAGNVDDARELFERSTNEDPTHVHSWQVKSYRWSSAAFTFNAFRRFDE